MKISIIIPFYQGRKYLEDCLKSLKEQYFEGMETILVLAQDAEDAEEVLRIYLPQINGKVVRMEKKHGVAAARNLGVQHSRGEYLYFLDSDDYIENAESIEKSLLCMYKTAHQKRADLVYGKTDTTWFQRSLYQKNITSQKVSEEEEENADIADSQSVYYYGKKYKAQYLHYQKKSTKKAGRFLACHSLFVGKKDISGVSVHNLLIARSLWEENKIHFPEESMFYADLYPVLMLLQKAGHIEKEDAVLYVRRKHNDPVNLPSLSQQAAGDSFGERMQAYQYSLDRLQKGGFLAHQLELKMLHYFTNDHAIRMVKQKGGKWGGEYFLQLAEVLGTVSFSNKEIGTLYQKLQLQFLKKKNRKLVLLTAAFWLAKRKTKDLQKNWLSLKVYFYKHFLLKFPIKEHVVFFESFSGKSYSDNPKYISERLYQKYPGKYKLVWSYRDAALSVGYPVIMVKKNSLRYLYYMAVAKYFVWNTRQPSWMQKRPETVFVETWHGTPLKRLFFDMEDITSASPLCKKEVYEEAKDWDYLIAPNPFSARIFRNCFRYSNAMLETGYPRNDILYADDRERLAQKIKEKLEIPKDKKLILYAPTWRDDEYYDSGQYKFQLKLDLGKMKEELSREYILLVRTHYYIADQLDLSSVGDFARNVSRYDDISELYLISDLLITDYSSVCFDYANLKRPMLFYTYDLEKYRDQLRGFYINMEEEFPGPLLFDTCQVIDAIKNLGRIQAEYQKRYDRFYEKYCCLEDGTAAEQVIEAMLSHDHGRNMSRPE